MKLDISLKQSKIVKRGRKVNARKRRIRSNEQDACANHQVEVIGVRVLFWAGPQIEEYHQQPMWSETETRGHSYYCCCHLCVGWPHCLNLIHIIFIFSQRRRSLHSIKHQLGNKRLYHFCYVLSCFYDK